jgi:hypothetical protein
MRVANFVSVAAIAMLVTAGPALGFVKIKKIPTKMIGSVEVSYKVLGSLGNTQQLRNCETSSSCITGNINALYSGTLLGFNCGNHGGCKVVGPK